MNPHRHVLFLTADGAMCGNCGEAVHSSMAMHEACGVRWVFYAVDDDELEDARPDLTLQPRLF